MARDHWKPVFSDTALGEYCLIVSIIADRIEEGLDFLEKNPDVLEDGVLGYVAALRVLGQAIPDSVPLSMSLEHEERLEDWEERYFRWFSNIEAKMPVKYREKMRASAKREFTELRTLNG